MAQKPQALPPDVVAILERGQRAQDLLDNPTFTETVDDLTQQFLAQMVACRPGERDREARDYAHLMQHAMTELVASLRGYAATASDLRRVLEFEDGE
jgi:hypothetical protein